VALVECIPNFSEGRRQNVIDAIIASLTSVPVYLLDWSADADHNRMVVTIAGEPASISESMFRGAQTAAALIDLEAHRGEHPRIGAVDVIPFVPLREISLRECVVLARALGLRIGAEIELPVYLYEQAALRPNRRNLAHIRRGGYETLKHEIAFPERVPDFGALVLGKAGAVAIGARAPLIAFNVYLDTLNVEIARKVAETIRESSGGMPCVKALGMFVKGRAQVSINAVDFRITSLRMIIDAVRLTANALGVGVMESELIGLIPQLALQESSLTALGFPAHTEARILEQRLGAVMNDYRELSFE